MVGPIESNQSAAPGSRVRRAARSALTHRDSADISASQSNSNGKITLDAARVGGGIKTVSGSIRIADASPVEGGIVVEKVTESVLNFCYEMPRIVIGPGATPVSFTGDKPPN